MYLILGFLFTVVSAQELSINPKHLAYATENDTLLITCRVKWNKPWNTVVIGIESDESLYPLVGLFTSNGKCKNRASKDILRYFKVTCDIKKQLLKFSVAVKSVSDKLHGKNMLCQFSPNSSSTPKQVRSSIYVRKPVSHVYIQLMSDTTHNHFLEAKCSSSPCRPPAIISWYLITGSKGTFQLLMEDHNADFKVNQIEKNNLTRAVSHIKYRDNGMAKAIFCKVWNTHGVVITSSKVSLYHNDTSTLPSDENKTVIIIAVLASAVIMLCIFSFAFTAVCYMKSKGGRNERNECGNSFEMSSSTPSALIAYCDMAPGRNIYSSPRVSCSRLVPSERESYVTMESPLYHNTSKVQK